MDDLSDKIKLRFRLNTKLNKNKLKHQAVGKTLHDVDGDFQVYINNVVYFDEREFLLLEFGLLLKKWINKISTGDITNFIYLSIEHDSPILEFRYNNGTWELFSEWRLSETRVFLSLNSLLFSCKEFLNSLEQSLKETYEINLSIIVL